MRFLDLSINDCLDFKILLIPDFPPVIRSPDFSLDNGSVGQVLKKNYEYVNNKILALVGKPVNSYRTRILCSIAISKESQARVGLVLG